MKYSNWQELHKKAFSTRTRYGVKNDKRNYLSKEELHLRAWMRLQRVCSAQELDKLNYLAFLYDNGFKKHDTTFN